MNNLFEIFGMSQRTENTIKELNLDKFKEQSPELYTKNNMSYFVK